MFTMKLPNLAIVDVETSGMSPYRDRIIEIGIIRVEDNRVVSNFNQLIDPERVVPQWITNITGIRHSDVQGKPLFSEKFPEVDALLQDAVFVAHNVNFDYNFFRNEYQRMGRDFEMEKVCTIKLSKFFNPNYDGHGLDKIIARYGMEVENRHRAYDDALILWKFINRLRSQFSLEELVKAIEIQLYLDNSKQSHEQLSFHQN